MDRGLWVAEVVRRKVAGLHQILHIAEKKVVDVYEPTEEGLLTVRDERLLTVLEITLTRTPTSEQKKHPGYHPPLTNADFLTKETWQQGEKERAERREGGEGERGERRERRERGVRGERRERGERDNQERPRRDNQERGG
jgi:ribonuclease P/MRP protein subunit RPP25